MLRISATYNNTNYPIHQYLYYSKREAVSRYKEKYNLKGKHKVTIHIS